MRGSEGRWSVGNVCTRRVADTENASRTKGSQTITRINRNAVAVSIGNSEIGFPVAVEISSDNRVSIRVVGKSWGDLESSGFIIKQKAHGVAAVTRYDQINGAVVAQISGREKRRAQANRKVCL